MNKKMGLIGGIVFLVVVAAVAVALFFMPNSQNTAALKKGICSDDFNKYCPGIKPYHGLPECVDEKKSLMSQQCQAQVEATRKIRVQVIQLCTGDMEKICKDIKDSPSDFNKEKWDCLKSHLKEASPSCQDVMTRSYKIIMPLFVAEP